MPPLVLWGAVLFTFALVFYSISIWTSFLKKQLKPWHIVLFGLGVVTDSLGTLFMYLNVGHLIFTAHSISGFLGLFLMVFHFLWASLAIKSNSSTLKITFHKLSILVWFFWLVSYISGAYLGITGLY